MYGLARGLAMLVGAGIAGALFWLATQFETTNVGAYWAFVGLLAVAGVVLAVAQLAGGWTKWGAPRVTAGAFLLGFLPALLIGGWVLLAAQPDGAWMQGTAESLAGDAGAGGLFEALTAVLPAIAFALGLLFGYTFDTTGARVVAADPAPANDAADRVDEDVDEDRRVGDGRVRHGRPADEPVAAERRATHRADYDDDVEEEYREPDREVVRSLTGRDDRRTVEAEGRDDGGPRTRGGDDRPRDRHPRPDGDAEGRVAETRGAADDRARGVDEREERGERRRGWFSRR